MRLIIDRFEGDFAICETEQGEMIDINREKLPDETKEGDVLILKEDTFVIDYKAKEERKQRIEKLMDDLWE